MASTMRTDNRVIPSLLFQVKTGGFFIWKLLKEIVYADYLYDVHLLVYPNNSIILWVVKYFWLVKFKPPPCEQGDGLSHANQRIAPFPERKEAS